MITRNLIPAERVEPDPEGGWSASDLDPAELVDNDFITNDPDSYLLEPDEKGKADHGAE